MAKPERVDLLQDVDLTQLFAEAFPDAPRVDLYLRGAREPTDEELILGTAAMMRAEFRPVRIR